MFDGWNRQRVLDLAPDPASAKAGQGQADPSKWESPGYAGAVVWGQIQGSGKNPYQVAIDLGEPAFKCSCPSRKFPCKHAIGLMLVIAEHPSRISAEQAPDWVASWIAGRGERASKRESKAAEAAAKPIDAEAQAKRAAKRDERIRAGLDEAALWLRDLFRAGLAAAQTLPFADWERAAARLVDAQAPGLARYVRDMRDAVAAGERWTQRMLAAAGRLHLAIEAYRRLDDLPPTMQADVRAAVGLTLPTEQLLASPESFPGSALAHDDWLVMARQIDQEEHLRVQRTWLLSRQDPRRTALVLDFAAGSQPLDTSLVPGTCFRGELVYYPSRCPQRALVRSRAGAPSDASHFPAMTIDEAVSGYGAAIAASPWIERWALAVGGVTLVPRIAGDEARWHCRDASGRSLPVVAEFAAGWHALAVTGGRPASIFGEWDGRALLPLAVLGESGLFYVASRGGEPRLWRHTA